MDMGERIRERRKQLGMSVEEIAKKTGVSRSTLYRYENGDIEKIPSQTLQVLAQALETTAQQLLNQQERLPKGLEYFQVSERRYPILGEVACGEPRWAQEEYMGTVACGCEIDADFVLRARGNSMINARILDGDVVFIRRQDTVENGDIAVVLIDDEATLKRVYRFPGQIQLHAENPAIRPIVITEHDMKNVRILGKAVAFQSSAI